MKNFSTKHRGFTFIEVMVAMLIFVIAVLAAVDISSGSVRATRDAKEVSTATWLLQNVMVELETRLETEGVDKGCEKKKEKKFDPPYEKFTWVTYCNPIDFQISEAASKLAGDDTKKDDDKQNQENMIKKMILQTASDYMSKALRELHAEVIWLQGKTTRRVSVTTHFANLKEPLSIPAIGIGGTTN